MYCTRNHSIPEIAFQFKALRRVGRPPFPRTHRSEDILSYIKSVGLVEVGLPISIHSSDDISKHMFRHCNLKGTGCYTLGSFCSFDECSSWIRFCFTEHKVIMFIRVDGTEDSSDANSRTARLCEFSDEDGIEVMSFNSIEKFARFVDSLQ